MTEKINSVFEKVSDSNLKTFEKIILFLATAGYNSLGSNITKQQGLRKSIIFSG